MTETTFVELNSSELKEARVPGAGRMRRLYREIKPALVPHLRLKPVLYGTLAARLAGQSAVANAITGLGYVFSTPGRKAATLRRITEAAMRVALRHANAQVIFENPDD